MAAISCVPAVVLRIAASRFEVDGLSEQEEGANNASYVGAT